MAAPGVTMIFKFQYRGNPEEWSQQYHFTGDAPSDDAGWNDLITSLAGILQSAVTDRVTLVRAYGYDDTDHDAVYTVADPDDPFPLTGAYSTSTKDVAPGDAAAWIRWKTGRTNTHGKPVYLRKYFHSVVLAGEADDDQDSIESGFGTGLSVIGASLLAGSGDWPGLADKNGDAPAGPVAVSTFVTTRTLKRRGPRP
jgi:hypothetical protein